MPYRKEKEEQTWTASSACRLITHEHAVVTMRNLELISKSQRERELTVEILVHVIGVQAFGLNPDPSTGPNPCFLPEAKNQCPES